MELILERELDHQKKAVDALISALDGVSMIKPHLSYEGQINKLRERGCIIAVTCTAGVLPSDAR